jgi:hypothetical protein
LEHRQDLQGIGTVGDSNANETERQGFLFGELLEELIARVTSGTQPSINPTLESNRSGL